MDSAEFLDLLGNANRRRILSLLAQKPCYVTEISEQLGVSPKAVIDHLQKLEDAGLVESRTDDRRRKYFSISRHVSLEVTVSPYEFGTRSAYPSNSRFDITSCRQVSIELESFDHRADEMPCLADEEQGSAEAGAEAPPDETAPEETASEEKTADPTDGAGQPGVRTTTTHTDEAEQSSQSSATTSSESAPAEPTDVTDTTGKHNPEESVTDSDAAAEDSDGGTATPSDDVRDPVVTGDVGTLARQLHDFEQLEQELSLVHRWAEGRITELRRDLAERIAVGDPRLVSELLVALAEEPQQMEELCRRLGAPPPIVEELLEALDEEGIVRRDGRHWQLAD